MTEILTWWNASENEIVPLHPNALTHNNNDIHEKILQGSKSIILTHNKSNGGPTKLSKTAVNEKMMQ